MIDYADFERAVRRGIRHDGQPLYPAMPYASYVIASDAEIKALYAYFMGSVQPVKQDNADSTIPWPANMRWPLAWWQLLFARPRSFSPDPSLDAGQHLTTHPGGSRRPDGSDRGRRGRRGRRSGGRPDERPDERPGGARAPGLSGGLAGAPDTRLT